MGGSRRCGRPGGHVRVRAAALATAALLLSSCTGTDSPTESGVEQGGNPPADTGTALATPSCDLGPAPEEPDPEVAAAPVEFEVRGEVAVMSGTIGADFVHRVCDLFAEYPAVAAIEILDVPGSSTPGNETLEGGLAIRAQDLDTYLPGDGQVESGGVDVFLAGRERTVADGGCLGVHSTEVDLGDGPVAAADLPRDDPEHEPFLEYFEAIGTPTDFYWFTLEAAPPEGIHYLTPEEMVRYEVVTGPPPAQGCPLEDQG